MALTPTPPQPRTRGIVLAFGRAGSGKTHFATTWPQPVLLFDADGGSGHLWREATPPAVAKTRDVAEILSTVQSVTDTSGLPGTIVIDGMQQIYQHLCAQYPDDIYKRDINRIFNQFLERLLEIPCNIVITSSEKDEYAQAGAVVPSENGPYVVKATDSVKIGVRPDLPQQVEHLADFVLHFTGSETTPRGVTVFAQRGNALLRTDYDASFTGRDLLDAIELPTIPSLQRLGRTLNTLLPTDQRFRNFGEYVAARGLERPNAGNQKTLIPIERAMRAEVQAIYRAPSAAAIAADPMLTPIDVGLTPAAPTTQPAPIVIEAPSATALAAAGAKYGTPRHLRAVGAGV